jgi:YebC/PmpR family DNA-binding regulatory protein
MAGHSHWAGIKHKKEIADQKRGRVFSKLLAAITVSARTEPNPDFNPRLRTAIEKARANMVPAENIERAVARAAETGAALEELLFEAYGPGGAALLIEAITDNRNRTVAVIKKLLADYGGKWAEPGSVRWTFEAAGGAVRWMPKFPKALSPEDAQALATLVAALRDDDDVQEVHTNAAR